MPTGKASRYPRGQRTWKLPPDAPLVQRLAVRRLQLLLSQDKLAARIGISQHRISLYERGLRSPSIPTLEAWVEALGLSLALVPKEPPSVD